jgi:gliding motility-associated-like protein
LNRRLLLLPLLLLVSVCSVLAQAPVAKISATPIAGCAPLGVSFVDASTGGKATSWNWNFGGVPPNVNPGTSSNPSAGVIFTKPGTYTITLTVSNSDGTSTATPVTITIFPAPTADFDADKTSGCFPTTVHFTDKSNPGTGASIVSWTWSYGDGVIDPNIQNPSHTYTSGGSRPVTLYVKNNYGCFGQANIKTGAIVLSNGVLPNFSTALSASCQLPVGATFTNQTTGPATMGYLWDFGDGSATTTTGSPVHSFTTAGSYTVKLKATSTQGCEDTLSTVVTIAPSPNVSSFDADANVCINTAVTFNNTSSPFPNSSQWDYGDGTPLDNSRNGSHTYSTAGTYHVTLYNSFSNCDGSVTQDVTVVGPPAADFTGTNITGCKPPMTSSFTDQSVGATSWLWDFGDGTQSTLKNPTHTYSAYGSFTVTLTASTAAGCSNPKTKVNYVNITKPLISIPALPAYGCSPLVFNPTIAATVVDGIASYHWDFGNGVTFDGASPPPQTYTTGTYNVSLTITTNGGCTASTTGIVKVGTTQPVSDFSAVPTTECVKKNVQFTDKSTGGADQWLWDFGDGVSSTDQNPVHQYLKPGTYVVKLIAYNHGCFQPVPKTSTIVINPPLADFKSSFTCGSKNNYTFTDASLGATSWDWDFGDGTPHYNGQTPPVHTYVTAVPKIFSVTLTVSNGGCTDVITKEITVNESSTVTASASPVCNHTPVTFTPHVPSYVKNYTYDFGDGNQAGPLTGPTTHTYNTPGNYNVKLITTDNTGCVETSSATVLPVSGPTAKFTTPVTQACGTLAAQFTDQSVPSAGAPIKTWAWDFGDGGKSNVQNPVHTFTVEGVFSVMLKVTDINGCMDSAIYSGYITFSNPVAKFTTDGVNFCPSSNIKFTNTSQSLFSPVYTWDFGDGTTPYVGTNPPLHTFPVKGQYTVTMSVKDANSCTSTATPVKINIDIPVASFTMSSNYSSCPPLIDTFTFTGSYAQSYQWNFGDGGSAKTKNASNLYPTPGDWDPTITVISPGGCIATAPAQHVHVDGPIGKFSYSPIAACGSLDVTFEVTTANVVSFTWIFADTSAPVVTTVPTITHHYSSPGQYLPVVTLEDAKGCKVANFGNQTISIDGITKTFFTADKILLCDNGTINFTDASELAKGTVISNYLWDFGDGVTLSGMNPTAAHAYTTVGGYNVTLTITTVNGCADQYTLPVEVAASPQVDIGGLLPQCEPATLTFTGQELVTDPNGPLAWTWDFDNGQTANVQNPSAVLYPKAGQYFVQLIGKNTKGCADTATQELDIYKIPKVDAGPDMTVCLGGPDFTLHATGDIGNSYTWLPPVNGTLSCNSCPDPMANSPVSTYFVVSGLSPYACHANDTVQITVNMPVTVNVSGPDSVCLGQSTQLAASGAAIYEWTPASGLSDPTIANPVATPTSSQIGITSYTVTGYDNIKCFHDSKSVQISAFDYPKLDAGPDATIGVGSSYQINATGSSDIVSLNWSPSASLSCGDCLTPLATPIKTTDYVLSAVNNGTCVSLDSIKVTVICNGNNFFVPNTFSPNGDGANDRFLVRGKGLNIIPSITIFNRWGQVVFEKRNFAPNDEASGWDGTFNGKPAPSDVYVYTIQILCDNATLIPYHGNVTLIR